MEVENEEEVNLADKIKNEETDPSIKNEETDPSQKTRNGEWEEDGNSWQL